MVRGLTKGYGDTVAVNDLSRAPLGMRQRLGIDAALRGDPAVQPFDEPVNGLDVDGSAGFRHLVGDLADERPSVLVSSHLMSEMRQTADHLLVIDRGQLIADASADDVLARTARRRSGSDRRPGRVPEVRGPVLAGDERLGEGSFLVTGLSTEEIGDAACHADLTLYELTELRSASSRSSCN